MPKSSKISGIRQIVLPLSFNLITIILVTIYEFINFGTESVPAGVISLIIGFLFLGVSIWFFVQKYLLLFVKSWWNKVGPDNIHQKEITISGMLEVYFTGYSGIVLILYGIYLIDNFEFISSFDTTLDAAIIDSSATLKHFHIIFLISYYLQGKVYSVGSPFETVKFTSQLVTFYAIWYIWILSILIFGGVVSILSERRDTFRDNLKKKQKSEQKSEQTKAPFSVLVHRKEY